MGWQLLFLSVLLLVLWSNYISGASIAGPLLVLAVFLFSHLLRARRLKQRIDFINQLKSFRRELLAGGTVSVDQLLLRYDSVLTTYTVSVGIVAVSIRIPSTYRLSTDEQQSDGLLYSFATVIAGWWSLTGPVHTLQALAENIGGGEKKTVGELIDPNYSRFSDATTVVLSRSGK